MQAEVWCQQHRLRDAESEALGALEIFEKLGAVNNARTTRDLLQRIEQEMESRSINLQGVPLKTILSPTSINFPFLDTVHPPAP